MKKKILLVAAGIILMAVNVWAEKKCPYSFSDYRIITENPPVETVCGVAVLSIKNEGTKKIKSFEMVLTVAEEFGENPFSGGNCLISQCNSEINPGQKINLMLNLDAYFVNTKEVPLFIEELFLKKIVFEDDSVWTDVCGLYGVMEAR